MLTGKLLLTIIESIHDHCCIISWLEAFIAKADILYSCTG